MKAATSAALTTRRARVASPLRQLVVLSASVSLIVVQVAAQSPAPSPQADTYVYAPASKATYLKFADETEALLRGDVLGVWFPRAVDREHGGFRADFTRAWEPAPSEGKFSVFQGRMTWVAAQVVMRRPDLKEQFLPFVRRGVDYLSDVMWDKRYGGFFWGLDDD